MLSDLTCLLLTAGAVALFVVICVLLVGRIDGLGQ